MQHNRWFFLVGILVICDQLMGWAVQHFWSTTVLVNHQAFFGLLDRPWAIGILLILAAVVLWRLRSVISENRILAWALALIVGGGLANLIDRIAHGGVIDYVPVVGWFTFNLADAEISVGTAAFIAMEFFRQSQKSDQ